MTRELVVDVRVENHGTVWTFEPLTAKAKAVFEEKVQAESWQWLGGALGVDHRMAEDLADNLQAIDGLVLG